MRISVCVAAIVGVVLAGVGASAQDWPQWRGPKRTGRSSETGLLKQWPEGGPKKVWSITGLGEGYSGIVARDGRIYTMGTADGNEVVFAFDFKTGRKIWTSISSDGIYKNRTGNGPRGTPTTDGEYLYTQDGLSAVSCLRLANGERVWRVSLQRDMRGSNSGYGYAESPLIVGKAVIVTPGGRRGALAALDKKTGRLIWRSKNVQTVASHSSPVFAVLGGRKQILNSLKKRMVSVDAETGELLWEFPRPMATWCATTAIVHEGMVFVSSGYRCGGGVVRVTRKGARLVWHDKSLTNHHGGVIRVGDYLYGFFDGQRGLCCVEFKTGRIAWRNRSVGKGSLVYADGHLYCVSEGKRRGGGGVALVEATHDGYREKGRFMLPESGRKSWSHPVVVGGRLFIRDQDTLTCWDVKAR